ncbi:MAG: EAL domain-containing protein [Butyrivibrio sp.]|nr:EAL domain-containing protein [Butyrivibrio sp.]
MASNDVQTDRIMISDYVIQNIDTAIANNRIKIYYQPVVRSLTRQLCGAESLARWIDPVHGFLSPDKFIGALEAAKLIHKLDCFMIEHVCSDISDRMKKNLPMVPVSVNFSRLDFEELDMLDFVENLVSTYDIPRDFLHIEITESMIASDAALMDRVIKSFRGAGYEVWMDDFGSAYSSLTLLKDYEFDMLKLDMGFLSTFTERSRAIITSTTTMAKDIKIGTLAEGVETKEQAMFLRDIGCERLQGYYFGKPMPLDEFFTHIREAGITVEERLWRHFYDIASFNARWTDEPLEILVDDGKEFTTLFMNKPYKEQIFTADHSLEETDRLIYHTGSPLIKKYREFAEIIEKSGNRETIYYTNNGNILCFQAQAIAENRGKYIIKGSIRNISMDKNVSKRNSLDFRLKELNHIFERILLINLANNTSSPLLGKFEYVSEDDAHNTDFDHRMQLFVRDVIYSHDRERYQQFSDPANVIDRIRATQKGYIEDVFRLRQKDGSYSWRVITLMIIPGTGEKELLFCIRSLPDSVEQLVIETAANAGTNGKAIYRLTSGLSEYAAIGISMWDNILDNASLKFFWKDKDMRFAGASRAFLDYFGLTSLNSLIGKKGNEMGWRVDSRHYDNIEKKILKDGQSTINVPGQLIINGVVHNIVISKRAFYENGKIAGLMGYFVDVDEELERIDKLSRARKTDPVTGLMNAKSFSDTMIDYAMQYSDHKKNFGLIILKNEKHERIAKTFDDDFTNKLLKKIADRILSVTGQSCATARTRDSIFALLTHINEQDELNILTSTLKKTIEDIHDVDGNQVTLRIKIASRLRSDKGITDENMYQTVLDEL